MSFVGIIVFDSNCLIPILLNCWLIKTYHSWISKLLWLWSTFSFRWKMWTVWVCCVYLMKDLNWLGAGTSCGSTENILSYNSEAAIGLTSTAVVLRETRTQDELMGLHFLSYNASYSKGFSAVTGWCIASLDSLAHMRAEQESLLHIILELPHSLLMFSCSQLNIVFAQSNTLFPTAAPTCKITQCLWLCVLFILHASTIFLYTLGSIIIWSDKRE